MAETLSPVQSSVYFLERSERWKTEKPYVLNYVPELPAVRSNSSLESKNIDVEDIRGRETEFTYSKNGFFVLPLDCSMTPEDYDDDAKVKQIYLKQVGDSVKEALGASRVQIYDYIYLEAPARTTSRLAFDAMRPDDS
ncbi:hypothetical protein N0V84_012708 [Fusarium piperis]|uniref:Uncharacterized protein n=1 Tax=Fusarium piperis TaxID=1435070 RepID=A0A9W8T866_9HYPO|nr:hypothetical protein N0V84_012708 [Fusarium piperis]